MHQSAQKSGTSVECECSSRCQQGCYWPMSVHQLSLPSGLWEAQTLLHPHSLSKFRMVLQVALCSAALSPLPVQSLLQSLDAQSHNANIKRISNTQQGNV